MIKKNFKKFISFTFAITLFMGMPTTAFATEIQVEPSLETEDENIVSSDNNDDIHSDIFSDNLFSNDTKTSFSPNVISPTTIHTNSSASLAKTQTYYYNTGLSCPKEATYSKYNLLEVIQKGDIIYEDFGGYGITGHIAIVDGIYTKPRSKNKYIRLIEATPTYNGVIRSILDDTRVDEKKVTILRVKEANTKIIDAAVDFCRGEIGSGYNLDLQKHTSSSETDWYCSELVWAAYQNQNIDIEYTNEFGHKGEPGVSPHDILISSKVSVIKFSKK